jgi:predicted nucleic acid-binding protein
VNEVFVDTSAFVALMLADDRRHKRARRAFDKLAAEEARLRSSSYVLVETYALLQRRVGIDAVVTMRDRIAPLIEVDWVGRSIHDAAVERLTLASRKKLSLVDCVSFEVMKRRGITTAFAYDRHFAAEGVTLL